MELCVKRNGKELCAAGSTKILWMVLVKAKCRGCSRVNAGHKKFMHGDVWE
jgi:hypothetical protein